MMVEAWMGLRLYRHIRKEAVKLFDPFVKDFVLERARQLFQRRRNHKDIHKIHKFHREGRREFRRLQRANMGDPKERHHLVEYAYGLRGPRMVKFHGKEATTGKRLRKRDAAPPLPEPVNQQLTNWLKKQPAKIIRRYMPVLPKNHPFYGGYKAPITEAEIEAGRVGKGPGKRAGSNFKGKEKSDHTGKRKPSYKGRSF